jgi:hypothetical protein
LNRPNRSIRSNRTWFSSDERCLRPGRLPLPAAEDVQLLRAVAETEGAAMSALEELLSSLAGTPTFPGCRCRGKHHLFDEAAKHEPADVVEARHAQAIGLCGGCPALNRCESWWHSLPPRHRPAGVVAGKVRP